MKRQLSVAHLSAINLPPPHLVEAAAVAGFDAVGLRLLQVTPDSPGYPLMQDAQAMRATQAALRDTGLRVSDVEFIKITPGIDLNALLPVLDAGADLGAAHVITAPYDDDLGRLSDRLAVLSEQAQTRGIKAMLEFFPWTPVPDLSTCLHVVEQAGDDVGILVDSLHFSRSGSTFRQLAAIPPHRLGFAHLCDAPVQSTYSHDDLLQTARENRLLPGQGDIDLHRFLQALPPLLPLGLEVPLRDAGRELSATDQLRLIYSAARRLTADIDGPTRT